MSIEYYIIDTETTGLKPHYNEVCEIGIVRFKDRVQLHRYIKCQYPERASYDALKITNKTLADLAKGQNKEEVVAECNKFFSEDGVDSNHRCIIAHNASFDRRFLHALWEQCKQAFPADMWLDTIALTKNFIKQNNLNTDVRGLNLHKCCDLTGVKKLSQAHNALVDSRNTYLLYKKLIETHKVDYLTIIKTAKHIEEPSEEEENND